MWGNDERRTSQDDPRRFGSFSLGCMLTVLHCTLGCATTSTRTGREYRPRQACGVLKGRPVSREQAICIAKAVTLGSGVTVTVQGDVTPVRTETYEQSASEPVPYWRVVIVMHDEPRDQPPRSGVEAWVARDDGEVLRAFCWQVTAIIN